MTLLHPATRIAKKITGLSSSDNTAIAHTTTVADDQYGVVYGIWFKLDTASATDLTNGVADLVFQIIIGSLSWFTRVHPYISHVDSQTVVVEHRTVDLGPWNFDFGADGLYSGVKGDDIVVNIDAAGTGIVAAYHMLYSGD